MAFEAPASGVPRIETDDIAPYHFPGLKKEDDAQAPSVKSIDGKIDLLGVIHLISGGVSKQTISTRFKTSITTLKDAYAKLIDLVGPPTGGGVWSETDVYQKCYNLDAKGANDLEKAFRRMDQMPPSHVAFVSWADDHCSSRMVVTKSFLLSYVIDFCKTPDSFKLKADLKTQYLLNDAAPAAHVQEMVDRHVTHAGTTMQRTTLQDTGIAADAAPSAVLSLASTAAAISTSSQPPQPQVSPSPRPTTAFAPSMVAIQSSGNGPEVLDLSDTRVVMATAVAPVVEMTGQMQLVAMLPAGETRNDIIVSLVKSEMVETQKKNEHERVMKTKMVEYEMTQRDTAAAEEKARLDEEGKMRLAVIDEQRFAVSDDRKRKDVEHKKHIEEYNRDVKRRKVEDLSEAITRERNEENRNVLIAKKKCLETIPVTPVTFLVNNDKVETPVNLHQHILDTGTNFLEHRFPAGTSLLDVEFGSRSTIRAWLKCIAPSQTYTQQEVSELGRDVARIPLPMCTPLTSPDGQFKTKQYFCIDLSTEPMFTIIDSFVKRVEKRRKEAEDAKKANSAPMHPAFSSFVAIGRPVVSE